MFDYTQLDGESARAFAAFSTYRDSGALRSLAAAWQKHNGDLGKAPTKCPGCWKRWSVQWQWVERARQFDIKVDALKREAYAARIRQFEENSAEYELQNQLMQWDNVRELQALFHKAIAAPITDITQSKEEVIGGIVVKSQNRVKGINLSGIARLLQQRDETGRQAIVGVREKPGIAENKQVARVFLKKEKPNGDGQ
jgi:hypothetical protein